MATHLLSVVWKRRISTRVYECILLPIKLHTCVTLYACAGVYVCATLCGGLWVCLYVCVSAGVAREPQFLYGPICFVLFVLLINEIRGAACWDGPAAPLHWTGPLSHGLTLFSKWMPSLSPCAFSFSHSFLSPSLALSLYLLIWRSIFFIFVFQFVTLVDALGHVRWLLVVD